jgi:hypothetical protein
MTKPLHRTAHASESKVFPMYLRIQLSALRAIVGFVLVALAAVPAVAQSTAGEVDPLAAWRKDVRVQPISDRPGRHTIHSYYVCNPESPDGQKIVYYSSTVPSGHLGDVCVLDRLTGKETVLAKNVNVEDAHRAACQQWTCGGKQVAFHDVRDGRWLVATVDVASGKERVLIQDRQLAFGQGKGDLLPVYGCHWNPGEHRDLELLNATTGEVRTVLTADAIKQAYDPWLQKEFSEKPISIFFPVLSPDFNRVFFKIAAGSGGNDFRSKAASHRQGLLFFDIQQDRLLSMREKWGHPAWHPDSRQVIEVGNLLIDSNDGKVNRIPEEPVLRGCHLAVSPDGKLFVTDGMLDTLGGKPGEWGVVVCDIRGKKYEIVHRFDNTHGAKSWRTNHPHPSFSADGRRIYFNVNSGDWTQLYVAEVNSK